MIPTQTVRGFTQNICTQFEQNAGFNNLVAYIAITLALVLLAAANC